MPSSAALLDRPQETVAAVLDDRGSFRLGRQPVVEGDDDRADLSIDNMRYEGPIDADSVNAAVAAARDAAARRTTAVVRRLG